MTQQGRGRGERVGFFTSLADYFAPSPIPENDTGPLSPPKGIRIATYLMAFAGVVFTAWYTWGLTQLSKNEVLARLEYAELHDSCVSRFGGVGEAAVAAGEADADFLNCQETPELTDASFHDVRIFFTVIAVILVVMGLATLIAAPYLRLGRMWARRVLVTALILTLMAALAAGMSDVITLGAALALIAATTLCYTSSGATYFLRMQTRQRRKTL